jgi:PcfJ-like protein
MTGRRTNTPKPVELLRDAGGIYGVGVSELFDDEAAALSCGAALKPHELRTANALILRPDWFIDTEPHGAVLQKIVGGFRRGPFMRSTEERLRQYVHHEALNRAGLPWPPSNSLQERWWAIDKKQQAHNRGIYHGLRIMSLRVVNNLIGAALEQAAEGAALRAARRFTFKHRECICRAAALSRRALQLTETFPVLALAVYSDWRLQSHIADPDWFEKERFQLADLPERKLRAAHLVDRGARLRDVAAIMNIPVALRHIKPGVAHIASKFLCQNPSLLAFMPPTTARARIWLQTVGWADWRLGEHGGDFPSWVARHSAELNGAGALLSEIADWVRAGLPAKPPPDPAGSRLSGAFLTEHPGRRFVVRAFTPSMSLKTVMKLSADWHEAVANSMDGPDLAFPSPWFPAATIGDYQIVPIETAAELYREGHAMHHCVGTYSDEVRSGR